MHNSDNNKDVILRDMSLSVKEMSLSGRCHYQGNVIIRDTLSGRCHCQGDVIREMSLSIMQPIKTVLKPPSVFYIVCFGTKEAGYMWSVWGRSLVSRVFLKSAIGIY